MSDAIEKFAFVRNGYNKNHRAVYFDEVYDEALRLKARLTRIETATKAMDVSGLIHICKRIESDKEFLPYSCWRDTGTKQREAIRGLALFLAALEATGD